MNKQLSYLLLVLSVVGADQLTKWLMMSAHPLLISRFLLFAKTENRGISWGLLNGSSPWLFFLVTLLVIVLTSSLCVYAYRRAVQGYTIYGELLISAGSLSNIIDRLVHGYVVDFIVVYLGQFPWPAFNIADMSIVLGVTIMFVQQLILSPENESSRA